MKIQPLPPKKDGILTYIRKYTIFLRCCQATRSTVIEYLAITAFLIPPTLYSVKFAHIGHWLTTQNTDKVHFQPQEMS